jgi:acetyl esterase/lipase
MVRKNVFALTLALAIAAPAFSQTTLPLWPVTPPGAPNVAAGQQEHDTTTPTDDMIAGKRVARIGFVSKPTLAFYPAPSGRNTGAAVVVFPGGAYEVLAYDLEGTEVCDWLNGIGVDCVLVKYRVPDAGPFPKYTQDLADAQRAVRMVRQHASEWHIDPHRVGVLGFSAGGHLVAVLGAHAADSVYPPIDAADKRNARPDFTLLIYPAYLQLNDTHTLSPEVKPLALTPPSFLIQTEDDPEKVENAWAYYEALKQAKIPAEMHLFANGGHGYGLRPTKLPVTHWPDLATIWLHTLGIITP